MKCGHMHAESLTINMFLALLITVNLFIQ